MSGEVRLTEAERESYTYLAAEGPMFTAGDVERIVAARVASAAERDEQIRTLADELQREGESDWLGNPLIRAADRLRALLDAAPAGGEG